MRRQDGGAVAAGACRQHRLQGRVDGDRVERVGIEDEPRREGDQAGQGGAHRVAAAAAADHGARLDRRGGALPPAGAQHQLRPLGIERERRPRRRRAGRRRPGPRPRHARRGRRAAPHRPCRRRRRRWRRRRSCPCARHGGEARRDARSRRRRRARRRAPARSRSRPRASVQTVPAKSRPEAVKRPGRAPISARVCRATTQASPSGWPRSGSRPDGTSTASTGTPRAAKPAISAIAAADRRRRAGATRRGRAGRR